MTRALALPARQVTALCKGAAKAGCIAEVKIGDTVVRAAYNMNCCTPLVCGNISH